MSSADEKLRNYILHALEAISGQDLGPGPDAWQEWWQAQG
jgi:hypothetical protein